MHASVEAGSTALLLSGSARVIAAVTDNGRSLDDALTATSVDAAVSRPALQAIAFGTLRWQPRIQFWLDALLERPADLKSELRGLLSASLHQLAFSDHPQHAIVHQAVEAARLLGQQKAAGLVNAVLRRFLREREELDRKMQRQPTAQFAHPQWLLDRLRDNWPQHWEQILAANNEQPPLWLRVNTRLGTVAEYQRLLDEQGLKSTTNELVPEALLLETPVDVRVLPGFAEGRVSIQDAGAQLAAIFLDVEPGMRVLDACAAPGGKACHILERTKGEVELIAVDRSAERLVQVDENLRRLGLEAKTLASDVGDPNAWWDERPFQRILLDVPCSATGVIRRHPDIKVLRRPADIAKLAREQLRLLRALWPLLAPGGRLLYASCSVLRAENSRVVRDFLREEPSAVEYSSGPRPAVGQRPQGDPGVQILSGEAGMDGFYYACLEKRH